VIINLEKLQSHLHIYVVVISFDTAETWYTTPEYREKELMSKITSEFNELIRNYSF
jgi:hypothetical protein